MYETDLKIAWNSERPARVDLNDPSARLIRQTLLADERETARRALRWRTIALVLALAVIGWQTYLIVNAQRIFGR